MALNKQLVTRMDRITTPAGSHDLYAWLADVTAQQGDLPALEQYAPQAEAIAARSGHRLYLAIALRARGLAAGLAGREAEAEALLAQALAIFAELETRWQLGRTLFELGRAAQRQGRPAPARDYWQRALAAFEHMRAGPLAERTRARLAAPD